MIYGLKGIEGLSKSFQLDITVSRFIEISLIAILYKVIILGKPGHWGLCVYESAAHNKTNYKREAQKPAMG